jgi:uncharacterized protein (UPF0218 family)
MTVAYRLTPELRRRLKEPLGELLRGSFIETMRTLAEMMEREKPTSIISVGDTVSRNLVKSHILPQLAIIDNTCMRRKTKESTPSMEERIVHVKNPQATITEEAIAEIQEALKSSSRVKMIVDGEEDLLTLIAVLHAPENSFVLYGQPYEGVVVIRATPGKKREIESILKEMSNC